MIILGLLPDQLDSITPAELDYLLFHHASEQRNRCIAGWWAGISYGNLHAKYPRPFEDLYPDPIAKKKPDEVEQAIEMMRQAGEGGPPKSNSEEE